MGKSRHVTLARRFVMAAVCSLVLVGCGNSSDTPQRPSAPPKATITTPPPAWESKYTAKELAIYREAVQRAAAYESKAQPIWAAGKATRAAKALFEDNLLTWQLDWADLQSYEKQGIQIARAPKVLSTEPESIKLLDKGAAETKLRRCVDATDLGGTINGKPLNEGTDKPVIQSVTVYKYDDSSWRFGKFNTTDKPCDG